jgi:hypothetical protein
MQVIKSDLVVRPTGQSSTSTWSGKVDVDDKRRKLMDKKGKNG